jgi:lysophospholipase L1-like esterase
MLSKNSSMKIYFLGDSISIHYHPHLRSFLPETVIYTRKEGEREAVMDLDDPRGANGGDSYRVMEFLRERALAKNIEADFLFFNCGLHDIKTDPITGKKQVSPGEYAENLAKIVTLIHELEAVPVWISTTPCDDTIHNLRRKDFFRYGEDVRLYNTIADRIMNNRGIPVIDLYGFTLSLDEELFCDHIHFHIPVRKLQAAFIAGWIISLGKERRIL